jgi:hypothetical protein
MELREQKLVVLLVEKEWWREGKDATLGKYTHVSN